MGHVLAETVIAHHRRRLRGRARRITIDLDPTDDPTHGQQEFTFFNGHYDTWCYLPVVATVTFDAEAEQYAVAAVLRPGNAPASLGACGLLRRLLRHPHDVRVPRGPGGRVRRGDGEQRPVGEAGPALDGPGPDALQGDRPDRASLRGNALRRQDVEAPAPRDHQ